MLLLVVVAIVGPFFVQNPDVYHTNLINLDAPKGAFAALAGCVPVPHPVLEGTDICRTAEPPLAELAPGHKVACHFPEHTCPRAGSQRLDPGAARAGSGFAGPIFVAGTVVGLVFLLIAAGSVLVGQN